MEKSNTEIVMSIKPEFVDKIFSGEKKYEFRRKIFKKNVSVVHVYSSSPIKMVVGNFRIGKVINCDINELWVKTKEHSGIDEKRFFEYFKGLEMGYAIEIINPKRYEISQHIINFGVGRPPQSFMYLKQPKFEYPSMKIKLDGDMFGCDKKYK